MSPLERRRPALRVLSLGAGVQSTTLLLMALCGEFPERPDAAIFADTGWEPRAVYDHLAWLEGVAAGAGIPVHRVSGGNLKEDLVAAVTRGRSRAANPPFFVRSPGRDGVGMLRRKCTLHYKVAPVRRKVRELATAICGRGRPLAGSVEQWFGISADEWRRMRTSDVAYITHRYPLVEKRMSRQDCVAWLTRHGYRVPPKSSCLGCPYHSDALWRAMNRDSPEEWGQTVAFDRAMRRGLPGVRGEAFLHRSAIPLDQADLRTDAERGKPTLPLDFGDECSGHCGV